jgi:hypothetical protein
MSGVGAFVGCFGAATDVGGKTFGISLHRELLAGHPIGEAVHRARRSALSQYGRDPTPLLYVLSGFADCVINPVR